jgi:prophage regulatory protein
MQLTKVIRLREVTQKVGLGRSSVYAKLRPNVHRPHDYDPSFPQPIRIGPRAVGWAECEIDEWLQAQAAKRGVP